MRQSRTAADSAAKPLIATAVVVLTALAVATVGSLTAYGQDAAPGLTGSDRPDDVVLARQLLMDELETVAPAFDQAAAGGDFNLQELQGRAYLMSTLFSIFPHLFPPETSPVVGPDGAPPAANATAAIWEDFDEFYGLVTDAANLSFDLRFGDDREQFRENAKALRASCDSCHEQYMLVAGPSQP